MLTQRLMQIKQHSRRVLITKRSLPIFAFLIITLIIIWPQFSQHNDKFSLAVPSNGKQTQVETENLRFFGINSKKLPMTLDTPSIHQTDNTTDRIRMEKPIGTYQMNSGDIMTLTAPYALINQTKEEIFFEDQINIKTDSGYIGKTSQVLCNYNEGTADGDSPISISGPAGKLNAQGIWMADKGNLILFKKKATAHIKNKKQMMTVSAQSGIQINQIAKTMTATDQVKMTQGNETMTADKAILYYTDDKNNRVQKIEGFGDIVIDNKKQKISGDHGFYNPQSKIAEVEGHVIITQSDHQIRGDKAVINMETGKSELISDRIKGQLMPKDVKGENK